MTVPFASLRFPFYLCIMALAGCAAVGPDYAKTAPKAPDTWSSAPASNIVASTPDIAEWWRQLNDPLLDSLIQQGLANSPDIHAAQAKLKESRARRDLASGNRFPTLSASLSGSRSRGSRALGGGETSNLFSAGFDASWEPDIFGGQSRALQASEADLEGVAASLQNVRVTLAAEIALNYVELRSAQTRLAIAQQNLATQTETLQITDWRAQAGLATSLDVEQARANREQTLASIPNLQIAMNEAENRLAILLGQFPGALHAELDKVAPLPTIPASVAVGIPADTLRQRPDVRVAERTLAAETARIGEQTAALYPGFSLSGNFGWKALSLGALGNVGTVASSLAASMAQTLFDAGRIRSRINIQTAVQEQALVNYEKTVLTALEEVENALTAYARNQERKAALYSAQEASRNAATLARQQYESGLVDFQKVLDTQRTLLSNEDSLASTEAEALSALITLYKALGGGWADQETQPENLQP